MSSLYLDLQGPWLIFVEYSSPAELEPYVFILEKLFNNTSDSKTLFISCSFETLYDTFSTLLQINS